ncbi:MAG: Holliday junction DNA helicase RuvA [Bacteroidetes bacterium RIFCSPLOWO2_02_FULL_36_8]|nr:MAG: Holliday junction DNA helicase RuvA [Bacteroidetes bacterium RIFCSPLOWO2_02_FULL_36_8]OFY69097.1 MAG: Holliday junction DNA helicase RuvA [Bacteroidetes bacterium RIFCSPLOWO2_12_FULL_37_12]
MSRILAIDYGKKRTGIAVTDPLKMIASPLVCIDTPDIFIFLENYFKTEKVETLVIGYPLNTNGSATDVTKDVIRYKNNIQKKFPAIKVEFADERYTSVIAHQTMLAAGLRKKARRDKRLVDKISAAVILQGYLNKMGIGN